MKNKKDKEAYLINQLRSKYIGDDGAVVGDTIYSMDGFFEDVHFKREWMSLKQIARKAMLVNLSDAIAMGAKPKFALVTLSLPQSLSLKDVDVLRETLELTAKEYGCEIIGGDTLGGDKIHLSITIISKTKKPLLRKNLKKGDFLAYTGNLGQSKSDLERLFKGKKIKATSKFYAPILRKKFIEKVKKYLHSGMDISDGLFCDTNKLLEINGLGFTPLKKISKEEGLSGEEYEMLISFPPKNYDEVIKIAKKTQTPLTIFAKVTANKRGFKKCTNHHF